MITPEHTCLIPVTGREQWWTCPECAQVWHKVDRRWKLTPREPQP